MTDLDEEIMVFHSIVISAEQMGQGITMVFLGVEAFIFDLPSAPSIIYKLPEVSA